MLKLNAMAIGLCALMGCAWIALSHPSLGQSYPPESIQPDSLSTDIQVLSQEVRQLHQQMRQLHSQVRSLESKVRSLELTIR